MSEIEALLEKAERSFAAAEQILRGGDADFAASRAYYGYFYVAEALPLSKEMNFSRHGQVIAQYGRHFAKSEILDPRFHRLMRRAFGLRQTADYSTEPPPGWFVNSSRAAKTSSTPRDHTSPNEPLPHRC